MGMKKSKSKESPKGLLQKAIEYLESEGLPTDRKGDIKGQEGKESILQKV